MTSSPPLLIVVFMLLISSYSTSSIQSFAYLLVSFRISGWLLRSFSIPGVRNNKCNKYNLSHSPLTFPSPKRSLPPTTKNRLRSEIDSKATTNVVSNCFAGCASFGSCGVGQPHELQNTANFKQTKIDVA